MTSDDPLADGLTAPAVLMAMGRPQGGDRGSAESEGPALPRLWRGFLLARVSVALVLVAMHGVIWGLGQPPQWGALGVAGIYLAGTFAMLHVQPRALPIRHLGLLWLGTAGFDLLTFTLIQAVQLSAINYTPLYALPVLLSAVLGSQRIGLATTALATLMLLGESLWRTSTDGGEGSARYLQAALTGTGLFALSLLAHQMAVRLAREEAQAARSRRSAQMHAMVNELVIETLTDGVLVIDSRCVVHSANPAADRVLGHALGELPKALASEPAWQALVELARATFRHGTSQVVEVPIAQHRGSAREVRLMTQLTAGQGPHGERLCVMFLQDLRELEARIRTAKLVSMGRMSAAVAHEIRNPLAAISQASALLNEDIQDPAQLRLTAMIEANTRRLARIVDDILDVSRAKPQRIAEPAPSIALDETVRQIATEWSLQAGKGNVSMVLGTRNHPVQFDVEHLRRILVNLLDNAARYAGHRDGAIQVQTETGANASEGSTLLVWSDGAPIEAAVEQHLFEPFFSSESRSSGLGLFICRQLCERHGASIGYERRSIGGEGRPGNAFLVRFASAAASTSASSAGASGTDALTQ